MGAGWGDGMPHHMGAPRTLEGKWKGDKMRNSSNEWHTFRSRQRAIFATLHARKQTMTETRERGRRGEEGGGERRGDDGRDERPPPQRMDTLIMDSRNGDMDSDSHDAALLQRLACSEEEDNVARIGMTVTPTAAQHEGDEEEEGAWIDGGGGSIGDSDATLRCVRCPCFLCSWGNAQAMAGGVATPSAVDAGVATPLNGEGEHGEEAQDGEEEEEEAAALVLTSGNTNTRPRGRRLCSLTASTTTAVWGVMGKDCCDGNDTAGTLVDVRAAPRAALNNDVSRVSVSISVSVSTSIAAIVTEAVQPPLPRPQRARGAGARGGSGGSMPTTE